MVAEIQDILDKIVTIQLAVTPPTGEKDIAQAWDEPSADVSVLPAFVNLEEPGEVSQLSGAWGYVTYRIGMHLLLFRTDTKYSVRSLRKWVRPVIIDFKKPPNHNLSGTVDISGVESFDFNPFEWNGTTFAAVNFMLVVRVQDTWE